LNTDTRLSQSYQRTVSATRTLRLTVVNRFQERRVGRFIQAPLNKIRSSFKFMEEYRYPWYVTLFTAEDTTVIEEEEQDENDPSKKIKIQRFLGMWLNAAKMLNLNPTKPGYLNYDTILTAVKNGSIQLDWSGLVQIWHGKMVNIKNKHLPKYITGVGFPNINLEKKPGFRDEFGLKTANLNPKMETIRDLFTIQYLGFCIDTLFTQQPNTICKKRFSIPTYLLRLVGLYDNERNELMYTLKYKRNLQFCITGNEETEAQVLTFCICFNVFRVRRNDGPDETRINLSTVYPYGQNDEIALSFWANHAYEHSKKYF
jgi:hypothetical protein